LISAGALGSSQRSRDPLAGFKGPISKGEGGRSREWEGQRRGGPEKDKEGREKEGRGGRERKEGTSKGLVYSPIFEILKNT